MVHEGAYNASKVEPTNAPTYPFTVPSLRFAYDALQPFFDARTMRLHHREHHQAFVDNLNEGIKDLIDWHDKSIEEILRRLDEVPPQYRAMVRSEGGGHANHQFLWKVIGPPGKSMPARLLDCVKRDFGSVDNFKGRFTEVCLNHFASGWAFLVVDPVSRRLEVLSLPNNDSVLTIGKLGLLVCDLWEHAHYLKYENRRAEYIEAFWNVVDWDVVGQRLAAFLGEQPLA